MAEELDINRIVAEFVNQNLESLYSNSKGVLKGAADNIRLRLRKSYTSYLVCVAQRYSKAKSFFIRNEPTSLYDFYVPIGLSSSTNSIAEPSVQDISSVNRFIVITGSGGSGKSILMRHLFLDTIAAKQRVPVFLELRELNQAQVPLLDFISETLHSNGFKLDRDYIVKAMKAGHFVLFLDGFDEIALSMRKEISKQIQQLAKSYDQNIIIVSSRPDNEFFGWTTFNVLNVDPLKLEQASDLVSKLPFDVELKSKFLLDLEKNLFEKHKSFLSNPLLLSIMLLTYGQSADIPNKLSVFYNQAYEALFQRHDALKGAYQRDRLSALDIQDFARVFAAFCIQTYDKRAFQFSKSDALAHLEKAKNLVRIDFNPDNYFLDALQAVCLLVEEGLLIVFSHRSFQEYFVAKFVCDLNAEMQVRVIDKYAKTFVGDEVMNLLYEMNPELVERIYVIRGFDKLAKLIRLKSHVGITHFSRYIQSQYLHFRLSEDDIHGYPSASHEFNRLIRFALTNCGHLIGWSDFSRESAAAGYASLWKQYGEGPIPVSGKTFRDDFIRDLAKHGNFFSKSTLQLAFDIRAALIEKHRDTEDSIDELLSM